MADPSLPPVVPPLEGGSVPRRTARAMAALGLRQVAVHGLNVVTGILLARWLSPAEFGVYGVVTFLLAFLVTFGDVGLGASLIRRPEPPTVEDCRAIFTAQQVLTLSVVAVVWIAAPWLAHAYHLAPAHAWIFRIVVLALPVTSFQTLAALGLERELRFDRLAVIEVSQAFVYNATILALVLSHVGPLSFAIALLVRAVTGAVVANVVNPWTIGLHWDWARTRALLRFGLPYQGISAVSLLKDSITPVFIGLLLGQAAVGYVNWATMVAAYPVMALMALQRVYLPSFARMQDDLVALGRFAGQTIRATNALVAPLAMLTLVLIDPLVHLVFGEHWRVALPVFYLLWGANLFVATAIPVMGLLNALGRSRVTFAFAVVWMVGTWLLGIPAVLKLGVVGYGVANLAVQFTNLAMFVIAGRLVPVRFMAAIAPAWLVAIAVAALVFALERLRPADRLGMLVVYGAGGLLLYTAAMAWMHRDAFGKLAHTLRATA